MKHTRENEPVLKWTPYEKASHLLVGYAAWGGGIVASAPDKHTAKEFAVKLRPWYPNIKIVVNEKSAFTAVSKVLCEKIRAELR